MSTVVKDLGAVSAYAYAVEKGYTGTEAEFAELMADYAEVGQRAEDAADSALESKTAAQTAATTATNKATEATTAATTATTKAGEASTSASTATSAKDTAVSASQTATTKATEATTAAATATSAKTDAVAANTAAQSAKTAAQTAQTGAETAAASVSASAAQIATNAEDISQLKSDLTSNIKYYTVESPYVDLTFVQGAWGTNGAIVTNSNYVSCDRKITGNDGDYLYVGNNNSTNTQVILTEWDANGAYIGNVSTWKTGTRYIFNNRKKVTITFRKIVNGASVDIVPSDVDCVVKIYSNWSFNTNTLKSLIDNNFERIVFKDFLKGYFGVTGSYIVDDSYDTYAGTWMYIADTYPKKFLFPVSDDYDVSISTFDYSNGTYSNFSTTGWITSDTVVDLAVGKAMSANIRNKNGAGTINPETINYEYYGLIATESSNDIKKWIPKKVACIGDSLTQGVDIGTHVIAENYPYFMGNMIGCTVVNCGVAGADTKEYWHDNMDDFTFDTSIDTVLIMLGTNGGGIPNTLATDVYPYTDYNDYADTYCGCYCKIIRKIIELTQNRAQVILITPPYTTYSTQQLDRVKTARETIKEIGLYYNIPVIDVFAECGMGAYNADVFRPHDGCHFNAKGYHRLGTFIGSKVKSLHSNWELTDVYPDETPIT